jgi:hypothetical protein
MAEKQSLGDWLQKDDGDHNYFVVVPFTTAEGALWGAGHIETMFDVAVIGAAAVDLDTPLVEEPESV